MLHLLLGRDWTANRDEILRRIAEDVKNELPGRILMVPELISHDMERRLCFAAGDTASRFAEVLSFTRLARRVAENVGAAAQESLDAGGRLVAMASACRQLHSKLKAYASVETKPEFLTELVDAVDEFKRCCITSADLMEASLRSEGSLAQKLEELSLILEAYDSICARGKRDPRDQMNWVLEQLECCDYAENHTFYIDGFPDFTRQHFAIVEHLMRLSPHVTVSLNCDTPETVSMSFEKAAATARQLIRSAKQAGVAVEIIRVEPYKTVLEPVRRSLFQGSVSYESTLEGKLQVYRAESLYKECQLAADRVLSLIRGGCRYREIGIVCPDMTQYGDLLRMVFARYGLPLYRSGTEDILSKSVVSTVLSALDAAMGGFDREDVLRYLKSALSPLTQDSCDALENYAIIWGVSGWRWQSDWDRHPDGLNGVWNEDAYSRLEQLNSDKNTALTPLFRLQKNLKNARLLKERVLAVTDFLEDIQYARRLREMADRLDSRGEHRQAQILNQLWEILLCALEQLYDVLGETAWDAENFPRLLKLLLSQYDVGTIPPVLDAVSAGPVSAMRCNQVKHLIVLGALEGALPGYGGSRGVLTDQERVALRDLGVPLTGGSMEGLQAEFAEIYGVFCGASESIAVSCPSGQPSYVYKRLTTLAGGEMKPAASLDGADTSPVHAGALLAAWDAPAQAEALGAEKSYTSVRSRSRYSLGAIEKPTVSRLYGKTLRLSASQVDKQAECRLAYFLRYGLYASERKEAEVDPAEFGTYVHAVLEHTGKTVMQLGGFHKVSLEDTLRIALEYSDTYAKERFSQLDSKRLSYLFERNVRELKLVVRELWLELHHSQFEPCRFELGFGEGKTLPAIEIPNSSMAAQLRGYVDRVDVWQNYFRVVDYKTGRKDFDYCDVFNGLGLQMFLYLFALDHNGSELFGGKFTPAGVQYFPARYPVLSADGRLTEEEAASDRRSALKRKGLVLYDEAVLKAMEPEGAPPRLNVTARKDGTLTGGLADRDQMSLLGKYIFKILGNMVDDIASGNVEPNPYTRGSSYNACTWCPYKAVCSYTTVPMRRNYKAMSAQEFWMYMEKEVADRG